MFATQSKRIVVDGERGVVRVIDGRGYSIVYTVDSAERNLARVLAYDRPHPSRDAWRAEIRFAMQILEKAHEAREAYTKRIAARTLTPKEDDNEISA